MGSVAMARRASICSVAFMVPNSAVMAEPERAETTKAAMTGESSRHMVSATSQPARGLTPSWPAWTPT